MEHYKSRNNDFYHFTNPHDNISQLDDDDDDYTYYDESQTYDINDYDDDRSCDFNFHTFRSPSAHNNSQVSGGMNQNDSVERVGTFDNGEFIFQLDNIMKKISDKLQHRIEGISTRIYILEDGTCKLDKSVEDVKSSEERYHGTTYRKLRQMQSVLQEVHDGVLFLRDKHEIAETQLQLAKLQVSKRDKIASAQTNSVQQEPGPAPQSTCHTPFTGFLNRLPSDGIALTQAITYHPAASQVHETTAQQYIIPPVQQPQTHQNRTNPQSPHFTQSYQWNSFQGVVSPQNCFLSHPLPEKPNMPSYSYPSSVQHLPFEPAAWGPRPAEDHKHDLSQLTSVQSSRNYESEFHAKYMPIFSSSSDIHSRGSSPSSYGTSNVKLVESSSNTHTSVSQSLSYALPTAINLEDESSSEENGNTIPVNDIIENVTAMGFRRDLVRACVRKLINNGSPVDLNSVLDSMMKNK